MKIWWNPAIGAAHISKTDDDSRRRVQICGDIDDRGFGWQVWFVASSGFFTDSYNLFATNVILPSLAYIYWSKAESNAHEMKINLVTLTGSIVGQVAFGILADKFGRRKLCGLELMFVISGTLGLVQCSTGYGNSMSIMGWLIFWRFFIGVGIGAEYPLSAVITAEFAPTQSRARMLASVFAMQPLGQVTAASIGLVTLVTLGKSRGLNLLTESPHDHEAAAAIVDRIWRIVIGVGAVPAIIAIAFRLTIPESPRFLLDVGKNGVQALQTTREYFKIPVTRILLDDTSEDEEEEEEVLDPQQQHDSWQLRDRSNHHHHQPNPHYNDDAEDGDQDIASTRQLSKKQGNPTFQSNNQSDPQDSQNSRHFQATHQSRSTVEIQEGPEQDIDGGSQGFLAPRRPLNAHSLHSDAFSGPTLPIGGSQIVMTGANTHTVTSGPPAVIKGPHKPFSGADLHDYFIKQQNWPYLAGTSLCWGLLDFAFYGLGMGNPRVIAQIWASSPVSQPQQHLPIWADPSHPTLSIYEILYRDAVHSIITVSIGSLLGSLILIKAIDYIPRKAVLVWSFVALMVLFAVVGGSYFVAFHSELHALTITLYVLCQLLFNLGPNTLTFIIPAEIFPTRYRATCHGIAAAAGKLGSVIVQAFLPSVGVSKPDSKSLGWILVAFSFVMGSGAVFAWAWIPEVQYKRQQDDVEGLKDQEGEVVSLDERTQREKVRGHKIASKTLETLARGEAGKSLEDRVGFVNSTRRLVNRLRRKRGTAVST